MRFVEKVLYQRPKWSFSNLKESFKIYQPLTVDDQSDLNPLHESLRQNKKQSFAVRHFVLCCAGLSGTILLFLFGLYFLGDTRIQRKELFQTPSTYISYLVVSLYLISLPIFLGTNKLRNRKTDWHNLQAQWSQP